jgi:dCTP diphosphatase
VSVGELEDLAARLRAFAEERDWEQFHSPKNLSMALAVEAAELLEHFQWLTEEESLALPPARREQVAEELADVFIYLIRLADRLGIDLLASARAKIVKNAVRYPIEKSRGHKKKYSELD